MQQTMVRPHSPDRALGDRAVRHVVKPYRAVRFTRLAPAEGRREFKLAVCYVCAGQLNVDA